MRDYIDKIQKHQFFLFFTVYIFTVNYLQIYSHRNISYLNLVLSLVNIALVVLWIKHEGADQLEKVAIVNLHWIEIIFWIMVLFVDLSKIYYGQFNLTIWPFLLFGRILPNYLNQSNKRDLVRMNLIGTFPFLLHPLYGTLRYPSYYNNSVGVLQTIITYFTLIFLYDALINKRNKEIIFSLIYLFINLGMIYLTGSRTAILTAFFLISYFGYQLVKERIRPLTIKKFLVLFIGLAVILYLSSGLIMDIYQNTFLKWDRGIPGFDFTFTGRTDIWAFTLKNAPFLGGGQYFFKSFNSLNHGHNIIFNMLGFYGVVPFIAIIIIVTYMLYLFLKDDNLNRRLFILLFILVNMFEGSIANYKHSYFELLFFFYFGIWMKRIKNQQSTKKIKINL